jgi:NitT/TauT family transport system ATP-binding protein
MKSNEIVALVGPSGCGKSTILNIVAGFLSPSEGEVLFDGERVTSISPDRLVVFQTPTLFPWLSVRENVSFGPRMRREPKSNYEEFADQLIADVGLERFCDHYPYQLSGGMRQRVQIARAFINRPDVLLMDEPFGALDAQTRLEMQEMLLKVWQNHRTTILIITHDVEEALFLSDRVLLLSAHPGRIKEAIEVPFDRSRDIEVLGDPVFASMKSNLISSLNKLKQTSKKTTSIKVST